VTAANRFFEASAAEVTRHAKPPARPLFPASSSTESDVMYFAECRERMRLWVKELLTGDEGDLPAERYCLPYAEHHAIRELQRPLRDTERELLFRAVRDVLERAADTPQRRAAPERAADDGGPVTTALIEVLKPTLRDYAIGAWQRQVEAQDAEAAEQRAADLRRRADVLLIALRDKLGVTENVLVGELAGKSPSGFVASVGDLRFTLKDLPYADSYHDRDRLHVAVPCSRGCGKDLWVSVETLEELGGVLQEDASNTHNFHCLQQFDDEGEPTTDISGNPLPPRGPFTYEKSSWQRANGRIASIEDAAREMAIAQDRATRLEDERAPLKAAAIKRLMSQTNDLTGKLHSASSAEAVVELDAEYADYRGMQRDAEVERHRTIAAYEIAKLTARLAVESFVVEERNR